MQTNAIFWDRIAKKYRERPIQDPQAYEATMERVASHLRGTDRVLEIGCGTGGTAVRLAPLVAQMVAVDFAPGMIAQARAREGAERVDFRDVDVHHVELEAATFDAVMGFNLFHLVADLRAELARIHALLEPGGLMISKTPCLTDPSAGFAYRALVRVIPVMRLFGKAPFAQFRSIAVLQRMIEEAGFEIIETGNYPMQPPSHFVVARKI